MANASAVLAVRTLARHTRCAVVHTHLLGSVLPRVLCCVHVPLTSCRSETSQYEAVRYKCHMRTEKRRAFTVEENGSSLVLSL